MYSPAKCIGCEIKAVTGDPDPDHISTSYILRFTRLTNGFSKKVDNRAAQIAIFIVVYNFSRKHMTLGTTPAVKAGIADRVGSIEAACSRFSSSPILLPVWQRGPLLSANLPLVVRKSHD